MQYAKGRMLAEVDDGVGLVTFNQPAKQIPLLVNSNERSTLSD